MYACMGAEEVEGMVGSVLNHLSSTVTILVTGEGSALPWFM